MRSPRCNGALALFLSLMLLCALALPAFAAPSAFSLSVTAYPGRDDTRVCLFFEEASGEYYLFLPSDCDASSMRIDFTGASSVSVDSAAVSSGSQSSAFTPGQHTLAVDGKTYPLQVLVSSSLPAVFIDTESGSLDALRADKEHKESGVITVVSGGKVEIDSALLKSVKGRGNSTWAADKKPFNIKFDKKTDVLGMGKAKKWSLLANHFDATLLRNVFAFGFAEALGLPYTPSCRMVDLYANGEYQGNYLITESVEVGETRVNVADLDAANEDANEGADVEDGSRRSADFGVSGSIKWVDIASPADVTGGYILETEFSSRYPEEVSGFVSDGGQRVVLKSPEFASRDEVAYVARFWNGMEQALLSADGHDANGRSLYSYFDVDSLVKMYILAEYTFHRDAGLSSCYFYKDAGENILHAGPAWDFDLALGNRRYAGRYDSVIRDPAAWWANATFYNEAKCDSEAVFTLLWRHEDFRALVAKEWTKASAVLDVELKKIPALTDSTAPSAVMNALRWSLLSGRTPAEKEKYYRRECDSFFSFATKRADALDAGFSDSNAAVYYDAGEGSGRMYNFRMVTVGGKVTLRGADEAPTALTPPEGKTFIGWSTTPSFGCDLYAPGEDAAVNDKTTVFYAQWLPSGKAGSGDGVWRCPGDVDLSGAVEVADARTVLRSAIGLDNLGGAAFTLADADADGRIEVEDARSVLRAAIRLGYIHSDPVFVKK